MSQPLNQMNTSDQDQGHDPRDDIIGSLRNQLQLQEQKENDVVKKYVDLLLERISNLTPRDQEASVLPAIQHQYRIIESQVATRRAELRLLNQQVETRSAQYEQLQSRYRELSTDVNAAVSQGPSHELAIRPTPGAPQVDPTEAPNDL